MSISIPEAVKQMLAIIERLTEAYPKKCFTLDGRLVGDIGEVLVEEAYDVKLFEDVKKHHDAESSDGRLVQIEVFNGPGAVAWAAVKERAKPKNNLHSVSINILSRLQATVRPEDRIPLRGSNCIKPTLPPSLGKNYSMNAGSTSG